MYELDFGGRLIDFLTALAAALDEILRQVVFIESESGREGFGLKGDGGRVESAVEEVLLRRAER